MSLLSSLEGLQVQKEQAIAAAQRGANDTLSASGSLARSIMTPTEKVFNDNNKAIDAKAMTLGLSPTSVLAEKRVNAESLGDFRAKMVGQLANQRISVQRDTLNKQLGSLNERIARKEAQRNAISEAAGGLVQAGLTTLGTIYGGPAGAALGSSVGGMMKSGLTKAVNGNSKVSNDGLVVPDDAFSNNAGDIKLMSV